LHAAKACGEVDTRLHAFLIFTLYGGKWSASCFSVLKPQGGNSVVPIEQEAGWASEEVTMLWTRLQWFL
jgi:hypothetical protein